MKRSFFLSSYSVTVRIGDNVGTVKLHEVGLDEKPRLAAAGAAHHQHVFVPRRLGVFGTVGHHEPLGLGENDVVLKLRIDVRGDILGLAP